MLGIVEFYVDLLFSYPLFILPAAVLGDTVPKFSEMSGANSPFSGMTISGDQEFIHGDFDADGDADIQSWDVVGPVQTWLNTGNGHFTNVANLTTNPFGQLSGMAAFGNSATNAFVADWDNDGDDDV